MKDTTSPYKDGLAIIDHLIDGNALPPHLARSRAGLVLPKHRTAKETAAEEARAYNAAIAKTAAEKMSKAPLLAVCFKHKCKCGNSWESFGFYARKTSVRVSGEGEASFTKRLDYDPSPEKVGATEWLVADENACLRCYGGSPHPLAS
jgi:hypothetical protein